MALVPLRWMLPGGYVSGYAEVAGVGLGAHGVELGDGDVVALVLVDAGDGEPSYGREDDDGGGNYFERTVGGWGRHG